MAETCKQEASDLPLLTGCPADNEYVIVGNSVGGKGIGKYAIRLWGALKSCVNGGCCPTVTVVSDTVFTIVAGRFTDYIFSGTGEGLWTLPPVTGNESMVINIKNRGNGLLIIQSDNGDNVIWGTSAAHNNTIPVGAAVRLVWDSEFINVEYYPVPTSPAP